LKTWLNKPPAEICVSDHAAGVKFDIDTITAELAAKQCKQCGHIGARSPGRVVETVNPGPLGEVRFDV
jgi:hypothetical protein